MDTMSVRSGRFVPRTVQHCSQVQEWLRTSTKMPHTTQAVAATIPTTWGASAK